MEIKKIAEQYQKENGNSNFTIKELLWYNIHQVDELKRESITHIECKEHREQTHKSMIIVIAIGGVLISTISAFIGFVFANGGI